MNQREKRMWTARIRKAALFHLDFGYRDSWMHEIRSIDEPDLKRIIRTLKAAIREVGK